MTIILIVVAMTLNTCTSLRSEEGPLYRHLYKQGTVNGESLDWTISFPDSYQEGTPTPLILSLHFGGTPSAWVLLHQHTRPPRPWRTRSHHPLPDLSG